MKLSTKDMVLCSMFAAMTAVLAQISIPIGTVPFTMQVFAVALCGVVLGSKKGFIAISIYVLMGAIGMPVFANFNGGMHVIVGFTGGFIITFPIMALIIGYASERANKVAYIMISMIVALSINYVIGSIQYSYLAGVGFKEAMAVCVIPFVLFDLVKVTLATTLGAMIKKRVLAII